jgi:hypothetical protein
MRNEIWTKAANLRKESAELMRKAQWQAGCLAEEGAGSAEIDAATAAKMARISEIDSEIATLMAEWAVS